MSKLTFPTLKYLINDMILNHADKEKFSFEYNKLTFDVIFSFKEIGYEFLIGIHTLNFGILVQVTPNYVAELTDKDYYRLCDILKLIYKDGGFNSNAFLKLLSNHIPDHYSGFKYTSAILRPFVVCRNVEESAKVYFHGWNDHTKDNRTAQNFDKTEFFFGKAIADYCRKNNISSMWTDIPKDVLKDSTPPKY